jgi:hypothetical protein
MHDASLGALSALSAMILQWRWCGREHVIATMLRILAGKGGVFQHTGGS